jgi:hypothetical protein
MGEVRILVSFLYRNHLDEVRRFEIPFTSIHDLRNYLRWEPEKAMLWGYGNVDEDAIRKSRTSDVTVSIEANGQTYTFVNATQFAEFLKKEKTIAIRLQFYQ